MSDPKRLNSRVPSTLSQPCTFHLLASIQYPVLGPLYQLGSMWFNVPLTTRQHTFSSILILLHSFLRLVPSTRYQPLFSTFYPCGTNLYPLPCYPNALANTLYYLPFNRYPLARSFFALLCVRYPLVSTFYPCALLSCPLPVPTSQYLLLSLQYPLSYFHQFSLPRSQCQRASTKYSTLDPLLSGQYRVYSTRCFSSLSTPFTLRNLCANSVSNKILHSRMHDRPLTR